MPKKLSAGAQSGINLLNAAKAIRKATNDIWGVAPKAPMFTRKMKTSSGKKKIVRTKRIIGTHAFKIAASGAAAYTAAVFQRESKVLRLAMTDESKRCPCLPIVSPGAVAVMENFLVAYAQEATRNAVTIKNGLGTSKRLNGKLMKMGFDQADKAIFGASGPAHTCLSIAKPQKAKATKKGGKAEADARDYEPEPPEAE